MKISNGNLKLSQLEEGKWYYLENHGRDHSNKYTGIKLKNNWIHTVFIGGEFETEFEMRFQYSQESLNEIWQHDFQEDYKHPLDRDIDDLNWVNDIAGIPYTMCSEIGYQPKYVEQL